MLEVRTVGEINDMISPGEDLNLALKVIRNLIVDVTREIRMFEKFSQIRLNTRNKIKTLLLFQQKMIVMCVSLEKKIILI